MRLVTLACVSAPPMPRRSVKLARHLGCVNAAFAECVLKVYGAVEKVPVEAGLSVEEMESVRAALAWALAM